MKTNKVFLFGMLAFVIFILIAISFLAISYKTEPIRLSGNGETNGSRWSVYIPGITYLDWIIKLDHRVNAKYYITIPPCQARIIFPILKKYDRGKLGNIHFTPITWRDKKGEAWVMSRDVFGNILPPARNQREYEEMLNALEEDKFRPSYGFSNKFYNLRVDPQDERRLIEIITTVKEIYVEIESSCGEEIWRER